MQLYTKHLSYDSKEVIEYNSSHYDILLENDIPIAATEVFSHSSRTEASSTCVVFQYPYFSPRVRQVEYIECVK